MNIFAKIFDIPEIGQILIRKTTNDEGQPAIAFEIDHDAMVPEIKNAFVDTDDGWDARDKIFEEIDFEKAEEAAKSLHSMVEGIMNA